MVTGAWRSAGRTLVDSNRGFANSSLKTDPDKITQIIKKQHYHKINIRLYYCVKHASEYATTTRVT